jgi:hypothetical protein
LETGLFWDRQRIANLQAVCKRRLVSALRAQNSATPTANGKLAEGRRARAHDLPGVELLAYSIVLPVSEERPRRTPRKLTASVGGGTIVTEPDGLSGKHGEDGSEP